MNIYNKNLFSSLFINFFLLSFFHTYADLVRNDAYLDKKLEKLIANFGSREYFPNTFPDHHLFEASLTENQLCLTKDCLGDVSFDFDIKLKKGYTSDFVATYSDGSNKLYGKVWIPKLTSVVSLDFQYFAPIADICHLLSVDNDANSAYILPTMSSAFVDLCMDSANLRKVVTSVPTLAPHSYFYNTWSETDSEDKLACGYQQSTAMVAKQAATPVVRSSNGAAVYRIIEQPNLEGVLCIELGNVVTCTNIRTDISTGVVIDTNGYIIKADLSSVVLPTKVKSGYVIARYTTLPNGTLSVIDLRYAQNLGKEVAPTKGVLGEFRTNCVPNPLDMSCGVQSYDIKSDFTQNIRSRETFNSQLLGLKSAATVTNTYIRYDGLYMSSEFSNLYPNQQTLISLIANMLIAACVIASITNTGISASVSGKSCYVIKPTVVPDSRFESLYTTYNTMEKSIGMYQIQKPQTIRYSISDKSGTINSLYLHDYEDQVIRLSTLTSGLKLNVVEDYGKISSFKIDKCRLYVYTVGSYCTIRVTYTGLIGPLPIVCRPFNCIKSFFNAQQGDMTTNIEIISPGLSSTKPTICYTSVDGEVCQTSNNNEYVKSSPGQYLQVSQSDSSVYATTYASFNDLLFNNVGVGVLFIFLIIFTVCFVILDALIIKYFAGVIILMVSSQKKNMVRADDESEPELYYSNFTSSFSLGSFSNWPFYLQLYTILHFKNFSYNYIFSTLLLLFSFYSYSLSQLISTNLDVMYTLENLTINPGPRQNFPYTNPSQVHEFGTLTTDNSCSGDGCIGDVTIETDIMLEKGFSKTFTATPVDELLQPVTGTVWVSKLDTLVTLGFEYFAPIGDICYLFAAGTDPDKDFVLSSRHPDFHKHCFDSAGVVKDTASIATQVPFSYSYNSWTEYDLNIKYLCAHWTADPMKAVQAAAPYVKSDSGAVVYKIVEDPILEGYLCMEIGTETACSPIRTDTTEGVKIELNGYIIKADLNKYIKPTKFQDGFIVLKYHKLPNGTLSVVEMRYATSLGRDTPPLRGSIGEFRTNCVPNPVDMTCGLQSYDFGPYFTQTIKAVEKPKQNAYFRPYVYTNRTNYMVHEGIYVYQPVGPSQHLIGLILGLIFGGVVIAGTATAGVASGAIGKECTTVRPSIVPDRHFNTIFENNPTLENTIGSHQYVMPSTAPYLGDRVGTSNVLVVNDYESQPARLSVTASGMRLNYVEDLGRITNFNVEKCKYYSYSVGSVCTLRFTFTGLPGQVQIRCTPNICLKSYINVHQGDMTTTIAISSPGTSREKQRVCYTTQDGEKCADSKNDEFVDQKPPDYGNVGESDGNQSSTTHVSFWDLLFKNLGLGITFIILIVLSIGLIILDIFVIKYFIGVLITMCTAKNGSSVNAQPFDEINDFFQTSRLTNFIYLYSLIIILFIIFKLLKSKKISSFFVKLLFLFSLVTGMDCRIYKLTNNRFKYKDYDFDCDRVIKFRDFTLFKYEGNCLLRVRDDFNYTTITSYDMVELSNVPYCNTSSVVLQPYCGSAYFNNDFIYTPGSTIYYGRVMANIEVYGGFSAIGDYARGWCNQFMTSYYDCNHTNLVRITTSQSLGSQPGYKGPKYLQSEAFVGTPSFNLHNSNPPFALFDDGSFINKTIHAGEYMNMFIGKYCNNLNDCSYRGKIYISNNDVFPLPTTTSMLIWYYFYVVVYKQFVTASVLAFSSFNDCPNSGAPTCLHGMAIFPVAYIGDTPYSDPSVFWLEKMSLTGTVTDMPVFMDIITILPRNFIEEKQYKDLFKSVVTMSGNLEYNFPGIHDSRILTTSHFTIKFNCKDRCTISYTISNTTVMQAVTMIASNARSRSKFDLRLHRVEHQLINTTGNCLEDASYLYVEGTRFNVRPGVGSLKLTCHLISDTPYLTLYCRGNNYHAYIEDCLNYAELLIRGGDTGTDTFDTGGGIIIDKRYSLAVAPLDSNGQFLDSRILTNAAKSVVDSDYIVYTVVNDKRIFTALAGNEVIPPIKARTLNVQTSGPRTADYPVAPAKQSCEGFLNAYRCLTAKYPWALAPPIICIICVGLIIILMLIRLLLGCFYKYKKNSTKEYYNKREKEYKPGVFKRIASNVSSIATAAPRSVYKYVTKSGVSTQMIIFILILPCVFSQESKLEIIDIDLGRYSGGYFIFSSPYDTLVYRGSDSISKNAVLYRYESNLFFRGKMRYGDQYTVASSAGIETFMLSPTQNTYSSVCSNGVYRPFCRDLTLNNTVINDPINYDLSHRDVSSTTQSAPRQICADNFGQYYDCNQVSYFCQLRAFALRNTEPLVKVCIAGAFGNLFIDGVTFTLPTSAPHVKNCVWTHAFPRFLRVTFDQGNVDRGLIFEINDMHYYSNATTGFTCAGCVPQCNTLSNSFNTSGYTYSPTQPCFANNAWCNTAKVNFPNSACSCLVSFPASSCLYARFNFNACAFSPCLNGGTCNIDLPNLCTCTTGFSGRYCQIDNITVHTNEEFVANVFTTYPSMTYSLGDKFIINSKFSSYNLLAGDIIMPYVTVKNSTYYSNYTNIIPFHPTYTSRIYNYPNVTPPVKIRMFEYKDLAGFYLVDNNNYHCFFPYLYFGSISVPQLVYLSSMEPSGTVSVPVNIEIITFMPTTDNMLRDLHDLFLKVVTVTGSVVFSNPQIVRVNRLRSIRFYLRVICHDYCKIEYTGGNGVKHIATMTSNSFVLNKNDLRINKNEAGNKELNFLATGQKTDCVETRSYVFIEGGVLPVAPATSGLALKCGVISNVNLTYQFFCKGQNYHAYIESCGKTYSPEVRGGFADSGSYNYDVVDDRYTVYVRFLRNDGSILIPELYIKDNYVAPLSEYVVYRLNNEDSLNYRLRDTAMPSTQAKSLNLLTADGAVTYNIPNITISCESFNDAVACLTAKYPATYVVPVLAMISGSILIMFISIRMAIDCYVRKRGTFIGRIPYKRIFRRIGIIILKPWKMLYGYLTSKIDGRYRRPLSKLKKKVVSIIEITFKKKKRANKLNDYEKLIKVDNFPFPYVVNRHVNFAHSFFDNCNATDECYFKFRDVLIDKFKDLDKVTAILSQLKFVLDGGEIIDYDTLLNEIADVDYEQLPELLPPPRLNNKKGKGFGVFNPYKGNSEYYNATQSNVTMDSNSEYGNSSQTYMSPSEHNNDDLDAAFGALYMRKRN